MSARLCDTAQIHCLQCRLHPLQGVLHDWGSVSGPADDLALLAKSYEALPSNAHRRMFLDAALLLHQQPEQHLTALWAAQLELDDSLSGGTEVFRGSGWRSRCEADTDVPHKMRQQRLSRTCSLRAIKLLKDLVSTSLVSLDSNQGRQQRPFAPYRQAVCRTYHTCF